MTAAAGWPTSSPGCRIGPQLVELALVVGGQPAGELAHLGQSAGAGLLGGQAAPGVGSGRHDLDEGSVERGSAQPGQPGVAQPAAAAPA
jgi:hypothetical protein